MPVLNLDGVFPPLPTPFTPDESIDAAAIRHNVAALCAAPVRGIVMLGSNGEAPLIGDDDSARALEAARQAVPPDRVMIAGTGRESTRDTIAFTRRAAGCGADAALVRTPSFFKAQLTVEAFTGHYARVADASPIPILLYNYTALTGVTLPPDAVAALSAHPNIIGMKESGTDESLIAAYPGVCSSASHTATAACTRACSRPRRPTGIRRRTGASSAARCPSGTSSATASGPRRSRAPRGWRGSGRRV